MNKFQTIVSSSFWRGEELAKREGLFVLFESSHLSEIKYLISGDLGKASNIRSMLNNIAESLENGSGVVIIKNLPVAGSEEPEEA